MPVEITSREASELSRFRYSAQLEDGETAIKIGGLLPADKMGVFLEDVRKEIKAPDSKVAASVFTKRFAFVAVIYLYALSAWDKRLCFTLDSLLLQSNSKDGNWLPDYCIENLSAEEFAGVSREQWREEALRHLFKEIVYPVLEALASEGKISKFILWENIAVYIYWLYGNILEGKYQEDFHYLVKAAPGSIFGPYNRNPLERYNGEPTYLEELDEYVRIRKTCCFTYQLGEKRTYCKTCPLYCRQFNAGKRNRH
jgi:ferric iron reductase protein FhuF